MPPPGLMAGNSSGACTDRQALRRPTRRPARALCPPALPPTTNPRTHPPCHPCHPPTHPRPSQIGEELRPFFCLDLSYAHTLLTRGFKIPEDAQITLVKRVEYNGDLVEAAWPLGAAINALG